LEIAIPELLKINDKTSLRTAKYLHLFELAVRKYFSAPASKS
jgi:hypothetical protein